MFECRTDRDEEAVVVNLIRDRQRDGVHLSDMAVLFRTTAQGKAFERALVRSRLCAVLRASILLM